MPPQEFPNVVTSVRTDIAFESPPAVAKDVKDSTVNTALVHSAPTVGFANGVTFSAMTVVIAIKRVYATGRRT